MGTSLYSARHAPLLRLSVVQRCQLRCGFCCWNPAKVDRPRESGFSPVNYAFIAETAVTSGYYRRIMLTGGEPLLLPRDEIFDIVSGISRCNPDKLSITTNGLNLGDRAQLLSDAGLKHTKVSLAASTQDGYEHYTARTFLLGTVLNGIGAAVKCGIKVRVDVPVFHDGDFGIWNYDRLLQIYQLVKDAGAEVLTYFHLHKTLENAGVYAGLRSNINQISLALLRDPRWERRSSPDGIIEMIDSDGFIVVLPPLPKPETENCQSRKCGSFCQGTYASYVEDEVFRFCHRIFPAGDNEVREFRELVCRNDHDGLVRSFEAAHRWLGLGEHQASSGKK